MESKHFFIGQQTVVHVVGKAFESMAHTEVQCACKVPQTMSNIFLHSAVPTWMMAIMGFSHIVRVFLNDGMLYRLLYLKAMQRFVRRSLIGCT